MARDTQRDQDQATYRTYDNRVITRSMIERALQSTEGETLADHERRQRLRLWLVTAVIVIIVMVAFTAMIIWRLHHPWM